MSEKSWGDMGCGCGGSLLKSPVTWIIVAVVVAAVVIASGIDLDSAPSASQVEQPITQPTPTRGAGDWDLTNTSINTDSACCAAAAVPLLLALAFAFKR